MKRRDFLQQTSFGLAIVGVSGLVLRSDAKPTPRSLDADDAETIFNEISMNNLNNKDDLKPTVSRDHRTVLSNGRAVSRQADTAVRAGNAAGRHGQNLVV